MYLAGRVASDTRDTQTPRYGKVKDARLNLGDIVFALPRRQVPQSAPTPDLDPAAIEMLYKGKVYVEEIKFTRTRKFGDQPGQEFTAVLVKTAK